MKRFVFVALMMVCSASWAEWEYTTHTNSFSVFHDKSTIRRNSTTSQMWTLTDYFQAQTDGGPLFKSKKELWKYNCRDETAAVISLINFSDVFGDGVPNWSHTYNEREQTWIPVSPGSIGELEWKIACGKK
jgi:hypothetical protein